MATYKDKPKTFYIYGSEMKIHFPKGAWIDCRTKSCYIGGIVLAIVVPLTIIGIILWVQYVRCLKWRGGDHCSRHFDVFEHYGVDGDDDDYYDLNDYQ